MADIINLRAERRRRALDAAGFLPSEDLTFRVDPGTEPGTVLLTIDTPSMEQVITLPPEHARWLARSIFSASHAKPEGR